jgi:hypothetical protein
MTLPSREEVQRILDNHAKYVSECSCDKCKSACRTRPCWGTPAEIRRAIDAVGANNFMYDYWVEDGGDIPIIAPAIVGCEGGNAPSWPDGQCCLQDENGLCKIHAFKPFEGAATDSHRKVPEIEGWLHMAVAMTWNTPEGKDVVTYWERLVDEMAEATRRV